MTLWFYIAKRFLGAICAVYIAVFFLATLFDGLELARRAADVDISFGALLGLAALRAPSITIKAAPFMMLLAAVWTYARLARSSELVVARAAGVSVWSIASPTLFSAAMVGVLATTIYNPIAASLLDRFERLQAQIFRDGESLLAVSQDGLWLRQGNQASQSVIHAWGSNSDATELSNVTIQLFEEDDQWVGRIDAERAALMPGYWRLEQATIRRLSAASTDGVPETRERAFYDMPTDLTADQIIDSFAAPETISFWRLPAFISALEEQGFSARRHILYFHTALAAPLVFAAMAMMGSAFSMRHSRMGGLGAMALYAALTGFGVYFIFDIANALAGSGVLPAIPAAWAPPFAALMLAAGLLLHFEDG